MDSNELIELAERQLAGGDPSATETAWRAHHELFEQRDAKGLERLLAVASSLDANGNLTKTIRHDLVWLSEHSQGRPDVVMDTFAILVGGLVGGILSVVLTYLLLHGDPEADAFVWLALGLFALLIGIPIGSLLGWLWGRRFQSKG